MGSSTGEEFIANRSQIGKLLSQLEQTIGSAALESYEGREVRHLWQHLHRLDYSMMECMDHLQSGDADLQGIYVDPPGHVSWYLCRG